jgi:Domain of unknown function (DUF4149)
MNRLLQALHPIAVTAWAGGLWIVGYLVAPLLFTAVQDRSLAGNLAGRMFHGVAWVGIVCGVYLLLYELLSFGAGALKRAVFWFAFLMFVLTLILQFWLQPFIANLRAAGAPIDALAAPARHFGFWHGTSSALYLIESLLAVGLVLKSRA